MLAALRNPAIGIVEGVHQPEDEAVEGLRFWKTKLLDHPGFFANQGPRRLTQLLQGQLQMGDIAWFDAHQLAADQVNGQAITSSHQYLQIGFIAVEWPLTILTHATIDDGQVWLDATIHINDALGDPKGMHGPSVRAGQYAHRVFHAQGHG